MTILILQNIGRGSCLRHVNMKMHGVVPKTKLSLRFERLFFIKLNKILYFVNYHLTKNNN